MTRSCALMPNWSLLVKQARRRGDSGAALSPCSGHHIVFLGLLVNRTSDSVVVLQRAFPSQFSLFLCKQKQAHWGKYKWNIGISKKKSHHWNGLICQGSSLKQVFKFDLIAQKTILAIKNLIFILDYCNATVTLPWLTHPLYSGWLEMRVLHHFASCVKGMTLTVALNVSKCRLKAFFPPRLQR